MDPETTQPACSLCCMSREGGGPSGTQNCQCDVAYGIGDLGRVVGLGPAKTGGNWYAGQEVPSDRPPPLCRRIEYGPYYLVIHERQGWVYSLAPINLSVEGRSRRWYPAPRSPPGPPTRGDRSWSLERGTPVQVSGCVDGTRWSWCSPHGVHFKPGLSVPSPSPTLGQLE